VSFDYSKLATLKPKVVPAPEVAESGQPEPAQESSQPDSSRLDLSRQPDSSRPDSSRRVIEPAPARPMTRQPESDRQPKADSQPDSSRQPRSTSQPLLEGLEHASHFSSIANAVLDRVLQTLPPAAQLAYLQLYRLSYGMRRNWCRIGNSRLAERCGIGESTLKRGLAVLEKRGLVEVVEYRFGGDDRGTTYYVPIPPDTPDGAIRQVKSGGQPKSTRQPDPTSQPDSGPMKDLEKHDEKGVVYEIRTIAARLFEAHRSDPGFDHERLRELVRDALIGQGHQPDGDAIEEAIRGMAS
jgi:hypothetical protein